MFFKMDFDTKYLQGMPTQQSPLNEGSLEPAGSRTNQVFLVYPLLNKPTSTCLLPQWDPIQNTSSTYNEFCDILQISCDHVRMLG